MAIMILRFTQNTPKPVRLDDFLHFFLLAELPRIAENASEVSKSKIRRLIIAGAISVDAKQNREPSSAILRGSVVTVRFDPDKFSFEKKPDDIVFELTEDRILYEDEWIIVVNKPADFPTEATMVASRDHLHAAIKRYIAQRDATRNAPYIGLHHRLDRETSGVILFTKTRAVNAAVHKLFLEHLAKKEYEALTVKLNLDAISQQKKNYREHDFFAVENLLGRISPKSAAGKWGAVSKEGDYAHTNFEILEEYRKGFRILALPETGRTHQIRVHLAGLGLPLLGDTLYGGPNTMVEPANQGITSTSYKIPRVMLHAKRLSFPHPETGKEITIEAPLPSDFLDCIRFLKR